MERTLERYAEEVRKDLALMGLGPASAASHRDRIKVWYYLGYSVREAVKGLAKAGSVSPYAGKAFD